MEELEEADNNIQLSKNAVENYKFYEKKSGKIILSGLAGLAYIGARQFIGPDFVDSLNEHMPSILYLADCAATFIAPFCGICGGIDYKINKIERKNAEKRLRIAEHKYSDLEEEWKLEQEK